MRIRALVAGVLPLLVALGLGWYAGNSAASTTDPLPAPVAAGGNSSIQDLNTWVRSEASDGIWIYPGVRNLDPFAFGNVGQPRGFQLMIGVPTYNRLDDGQGNWTTTALATPASNITAPITKGEARIEAWDRTPRDAATFTSPTADEIDFRCTFTDPFGRQIEIICDEPLPKGPFHEFFGGVGTNTILHGRTGIGGKLVPQCFGYLATWGRGVIKIDGQLLPGNDNRLIHVMVVEGVRDAGNDPGVAGGTGPFLGKQSEVDRNDLELHVLLPDVRFVPNPVPNSPVFGFGQGFIHVMFENVLIAGSAINGVLHR